MRQIKLVILSRETAIHLLLETAVVATISVKNHW